MTIVNIDRPADTTVVFLAMRRLPAGGYQLLEQQRVVLSVASQATLTPTDGNAYGSEPWVWKCCEYRPGHSGIYSYRLVPGSPSPVDYDALVQVDPDSPLAGPQPSWWVALAALQEEVAVKRTAKWWNGTAYVEVPNATHYVGSVDPASLGPVVDGSVWDELPA